jgi:hypothetical protein
MNGAPTPSPCAPIQVPAIALAGGRWRMRGTVNVAETELTGALAHTYPANLPS